MSAEAAMLFNSYSFICVFLPVTLAGFFVIGRSSPRAAAAWLAAASLVFYGWWDWRFVPLLLASIAFNFLFGVSIARRQLTSAATKLLAVAVCADLALLAYFKYANFFIETANTSMGVSWRGFDLILPLGISFFTFTQIAFLVDARRGLARDYSFGHYLLFVTYFPHLIAGPIIHHRQVMPQFDAPETYQPRTELIGLGLTLFTIGLAKKVLLAESFAAYSDPIFDAAASGVNVQLIAAWAGALAYTLQLYFDFSGYSDMAVGLSLMFGIQLPFNFSSPYRATSIIEFWRRWHMSLSRFLRDYVYIPLGGNRAGRARRYINVMATMLLGGLWHGAQWTFVAWGALHGLLLLANMGWRALITGRTAPQPPPARAWTRSAMLLTFFCVVAAWVLFRASSFEAALTMYSGMVGANGVTIPRTLEGTWLGSALANLVSFEGAFADIAALQSRSALSCAGLLAAGLGIVWAFPSSQRLLGLDRGNGVAEPGGVLAGWWRPTLAAGVAMGILLVVTVLNLSTATTFLYYQF